MERHVLLDFHDASVGPAQGPGCAALFVIPAKSRPPKLEKAGA